MRAGLEQERLAGSSPAPALGVSRQGREKKGMMAYWILSGLEVGMGLTCSFPGFYSYRCSLTLCARADYSSSSKYYFPCFM